MGPLGSLGGMARRTKKRRCSRVHATITGKLRGREVDFTAVLPCGVKRPRAVDSQRIAKLVPDSSKARLVRDPDACKVVFMKATNPVVLCEGGSGRKRAKGVTPAALRRWKLPKGKRSSPAFKKALKARCLKIVKGRFRKIGGGCQVSI